MKIKPLVSVIVTTRNEAKVIKRLIKSVSVQSYKNIEVILVDNFSTDNTVKIAKDLKVKCYQAGPERSAQRNFGAKKAWGEYLLFLDADMELSKDVIKDCVSKLNEDLGIGSIIIPEISIARTFWEKVKAFERSFYNLSGDKNTDAARFIFKKAFKKAGAYDEKITGPEDWDLPEKIEKLGYKTERISSWIYHHEHIKSLFALARKKYYYGLKVHKYLSNQNIPVLGPKTIYFLRPVFYRSWRKLISHPVLAISMFVMFTVELVSGGLGYMVGRISDG